MLSLALVKQFNDIIWLFSFYRFGLTSLTNVHVFDIRPIIRTTRALFDLFSLSNYSLSLSPANPVKIQNSINAEIRLRAYPPMLETSPVFGLSGVFSFLISKC